MMYCLGLRNIVFFLFFFVVSANMFLKGAYAGYSNTNAAADKLYVQGNYPAAAEAYLNIIKNNNSPTELNETNLALAYLDKELGDYKNSILFFKRYLAVCVPRGSSRRFNTVAFKRPVPKGIKSDSRVKLALAEVYYLNGEDKRALVILKELMSRREDYLLFLYLGLVNEDLGRTARALKYYRQCLKLRVNSIALYRMGKIFYLAGEYPKAINYFKELVKFDASIRLAYYYLGAAYLKEHEFIDAYRSLSRARMFYPGNADISSLLAYVKISLSKAFFLSQRKKIMSKRQGVKLAAYSPPAGNIPIVRIAVVRGVKSFSLKSGGIINLNSGSKHLSLKGDKLYTIKLDKGRIYLAQYQSAQNITVLNFPLTLAADNYPFYVLGAVYGKGKFYQSILDISLRGSLKIILHNNLLTVINILSLEDYLYGVLGSEIYPDAGYQAQKAQAVAARTFAIKYTNNGQRSICTTEACQVYKNQKKGGDWEKAVNETKRWVLVDSTGQPISTQYASTHGGYATTSGWDTTDKSGGGNWSTRAWENKAKSPWFYKAWYRAGYFKTGANCGRAHPWLSQREFSDIINAWIVRKNPNGADTGRIQPVTINSCHIGGKGGNPYSIDELKNLANNSGGAVTQVKTVSVSHNNQAQTTNVRVETNRGVLNIPGSEFKTTFNLRAPGYLRIPQSGFAFFNIEYKK